MYDVFSQAASVGDTFFMFFLVASILMSIRERNSVAVTSDAEWGGALFRKEAECSPFCREEKWPPWLESGHSSCPSAISEEEECGFDDIDDLVFLLDEFGFAVDKMDELWLLDDVILEFEVLVWLPANILVLLYGVMGLVSQLYPNLIFRS